MLSESWKPTKDASTIERKFSYNSLGLLDTVYLGDGKQDGSYRKIEMIVYRYTDEKLVSISQSVDVGGGLQKAGSFQYKNYKCGLVKNMEGNVYFGQYRMRVEFVFYSKGQIVQ
ncbi:MAG: hypothetical protein EOO88_13715 [Pedobacter sp.]|nr:MAG: hypothetical protein EOO88_13715 [Pedobacter sp.]